MTDTIQLLEAIGGDASLRYAQADELRGVLEQVRASAELTAAVALRDSAPLRTELGIQTVPQVQQTHAPGHPGDEDDECDIPSEPGQPDQRPSKPSQKDS